jgi:predicted O-methyltransferase YrrM
MNAKDMVEWSEKNCWGKGLGGAGCTYNPVELLHLAEAALACVPINGLIVEIGSYGGLSTSILLQVAREKSARVRCCDPFVWNGDEALVHLRNTLCLFPDVNWLFYPMGSEQLRTFMGNIQGGINFLHIDGDHGAAAVDCGLWLGDLVSGGAVAFHDAEPSPLNPQGYAVYTAQEKYTGEWPGVWRQSEANWLIIRSKP